MQPIRILIADDHKHARQGIREILEMDSAFEIVAEAWNGEEALLYTEKYMPDMLLKELFKALLINRRKLTVHTSLKAEMERPAARCESRERKRQQ